MRAHTLIYDFFLNKGLENCPILTFLHVFKLLLKYIPFVTHKAVRPGARPHVPPVMADGDFRLMTPLYDNSQ